MGWQAIVSLTLSGGQVILTRARFFGKRLVTSREGETLQVRRPCYPHPSLPDTFLWTCKTPARGQRGEGGCRGPIDRARGGVTVRHVDPTPYYLSPGQGGDQSGPYTPWHSLRTACFAHPFQKVSGREPPHSRAVQAPPSRASPLPPLLTYGSFPKNLPVPGQSWAGI